MHATLGSNRARVHHALFHQLSSTRAYLAAITVRPSFAWCGLPAHPRVCVCGAPLAGRSAVHTDNGSGCLSAASDRYYVARVHVDALSCTGPSHGTDGTATCTEFLQMVLGAERVDRAVGSRKASSRIYLGSRYLRG